MKEKQKIIARVATLGDRNSITFTLASKLLKNVSKSKTTYDHNNFLLAYCCDQKYMGEFLTAELYTVKIIPSRAKKVDKQRFPFRVEFHGAIREIHSIYKEAPSWTDDPKIICWWEEQGIKDFRVEFTPITFEELNHG